MPIKKLQALLQALVQVLLQALLQAWSNCYDYFSSGSDRNGCISRRGYWKMLAVVLPYHFLATYLDRTFYSRHSFSFQSCISSPYSYSCFLQLSDIVIFLVYLVMLIVFVVISSHRCRDIGISKWYILLLLVLVDYLKIAFLIILGCLEKDAVKKYRKKYRKKYHLRKNKKTDL